jgi:hypothetical protein
MLIVSKQLKVIISRSGHPEMAVVFGFHTQSTLPLPP